MCFNVVQKERLPQHNYSTTSKGETARLSVLYVNNTMERVDLLALLSRFPFGMCEHF